MPASHQATGRPGMPAAHHATGRPGTPAAQHATGRPGTPAAHQVTGRAGMPAVHQAAGRAGMPAAHQATGRPGTPAAHRSQVDLICQLPTRPQVEQVCQLPTRPQWTVKALCSHVVRLFVCPSVHLFVCHQTCEQDILIVNEPFRFQIGTSGLQGKAVKKIIFWGNTAHDTDICHKNPFWQHFLRTVCGMLTVTATRMQKVKGQGHTGQKTNLKAA